ncbi:MAG: NifU family protein [Chitinophagia bacterium]|nr:NifU family protein [Chitinophagia bacterium]
MIKTGNPIISIYTEMTPNPETMKFVANKLLYPGKSVDFPDIDSAKPSPLASADDDDVVKRIKELLDNYVRPAVEMDGGAIQFKSYEAGTVSLSMQGSCSGCPSSMITLKAGIEGMMKRMIPEVKEVVAESE